MKKLIILGLVSGIMSCNSLFVKSQTKIAKNERECFNALKVFVDNNWICNNKNNTYLPTDTFSVLFGQRCNDVQGADSFEQYEECLRTLNMQKAVEIFGEPSERGDKSLKYYLTSPSPYGQDGLTYMNLTFDTPTKTLRCIFFW